MLRMQTDITKKSLSFLAENYHARLSVPEFLERWLFPCIVPENPVDLGDERIFLAGDAASMLNPMGEEISSALVSSSVFTGTLMRTAAPGENSDIPPSSFSIYVQYLIHGGTYVSPVETPCRYFTNV